MCVYQRFLVKNKIFKLFRHNHSVAEQKKKVKSPADIPAQTHKYFVIFFFINFFQFQKLFVQHLFHNRIDRMAAQVMLYLSSLSKCFSAHLHTFRFLFPNSAAALIAAKCICLVIKNNIYILTVHLCAYTHIYT